MRRTATTVFGLFWMALAIAIPGAARALSVPPLPPGMCALNEQIDAQKIILDYLRAATTAGNTFITGFASCDELHAIDMKKATGVSHYGSILTQSLGEALPIDRKQYVDAAATSFSVSGSSLIETALTDAREAAANGSKEASLSDPKSITARGQKILFKNDQMLIIGMTQTNNVGGNSINTTSTAALTLIQGQPVSVNLYAPTTDANAFSKAAATLQPLVMQLIAANL